MIEKKDWSMGNEKELQKESGVPFQTKSPLLSDKRWIVP